MARLNINVGIKLQKLDELTKTVQSQLDSLSGRLKLKITNVDTKDLEKKLTEMSGKIEKLTKSVKPKVDTGDIDRAGEKVSGVVTKLNKLDVSLVGKGFEQLQAKAKEIIGTMNELNSIKYTLDADGNLDKAVISYKNNIGQVVTETMKLNKVLDENGDVQTATWQTMSRAVDENIKGQKKEKEALDATSQSIAKKKTELQSLLNISEKNGNLNPSLFASLQKRIDSLNVDNFKGKIDGLNKAIGNLSKADSGVERIKQTLNNVSNSLTKIKGESKEALKFEANSNALKEVEGSIKNLKNLMAQLKKGNQSIDGTTMAKAIHEVENSYTKLSSGVTEYNKKLKETEQAQQRINTMQSKLTSIKDTGLFDTSAIEKLQQKVSSFSTDKIDDEFKQTEEQINKLGQTASQINRVEKEISNVEMKLSALKKTPVDVVSGKEIAELEKTKAELDKLKTVLNELKSAKIMDGNAITKNINQVQGSYKSLSNVTKTYNKDLKETEKIQNRISAMQNKLTSAKATDLFNTASLDKLQQKVSSFTTDKITNEFKEVEAQVNKLGQTASQINRIEKEITNVEMKLSSLTKTPVDLRTEKEVAELKALEGEIGKLKGLLNQLKTTEIIDGASITKNINRVESSYKILSTSVKEYNKELKDTEKAQIRIDTMQSRLASAKNTGFFDTSSIDKLQTKVNSFTTDKIDKEFRETESQISKLSQSASQITRIEKEIVKVENKLAEVNKTPMELMPVKQVNEIKALQSELTRLKELLNQLKSTKIIDGSVVSSSVSAVQNSYNTLTSTVKAYNKELAETAKAQSRIDAMQSKLASAKATGLFDTTALEKLQQKVSAFSTDKIDDEFKQTEAQINKLGQSANQINRLENEIAKFETRLKGIKTTPIDMMTEKEISDLQKAERELSNLKSLLGQIKSANVVDGSVVTKNINSTNRAFKEMNTVLRTTTTSTSGLANTFKSLGSYLIGGSVIYATINALRSAISTTVELDTSMRDLRRVTDETENTYREFMQTANQTAIELGQTTSGAIDATTTFAQLGYTFDEASEKMSKYAMILANVGNMSASDSASSLVSILKGFRLDTDDTARIVDVLNEAGNKFALTTGDLTEGLRIGGASLATANNSLEESSALIISATEVLRNPNLVANGLKTISMRIRGIADENGELAPALGKMVKTLTDVDLTDANGEFKSTFDILKGIGEKWQDLNSMQQAMLAEEVAGKNRANVFTSIMQNYEQLENALSTLSQSSGSALKEQEAYMNSLAGKINALKESFTGLSMDMIDSNFVKGIVDGATSGVSAIRDLIKNFGAMPTAITMAGTAFGVFNKGCRNMVTSILQAIPATSQVTNSLLRWDLKLKSHRETLLKKIETQKLDNQQMILGGSASTTMGQGMLSLNAQLALTTVGLIATKVATIALQTAMSFGLSVAISAAITGISKMYNNMKPLADKMSDITEKSNALSEALGKTKDVEINVKSYREISEKLKDINLSEEERKSLNEQLQTVRSNLIGIDGEYEGILNNQNLTLEQQLTLIERISQLKLKDYAKTLEDEMGSQKSANNSLKALKRHIEEFGEMQKAMSNMEIGKDTVYYDGMTYNLKNLQGLMDETRDSILENSVAVEQWNSDLGLLGDVGLRTDKKMLDMNDSLREQVDAILGTANASEEAGDSLSGLGDSAEEASNQVEEIKEATKDWNYDGIVDAKDQMMELQLTIDDTKSALDNLADGFTQFDSDLGTLEDAIKEMEESGRLTDETWDKVITSGNAEFISILADNSTALDKFRDLQEKYKSEKEGWENAVIQQAVDEVNGVRDMYGNLIPVYDENTEAYKRAIDEQSAYRNNKLQEEIDSKSSTNATKGALDDAETAKKKQAIDEGTRHYSNKLLEEIDAKSTTNATKAGLENEEASAKKQSADDGTNYKKGKNQEEVSDLSQTNAEKAQLYEQDKTNNNMAQEGKVKDSKTSSEDEVNAQKSAIDKKNQAMQSDLQNSKTVNNQKLASTKAFASQSVGIISSAMASYNSAYNNDVANFRRAIANKIASLSNLNSAISNSVAKINSLNGMSVRSVPSGGSSSGSTGASTPRARATATATPKTRSNIASGGISNFLSSRFMSFAVMPSSYSGSSVSDDSDDGSSGGGGGGGSYGFMPRALPGGVQHGGSSSSSSGGKNQSSNSTSSIKNQTNATNELSKATEKAVEDLEDLTDRYYKLNDVLEDINNAISLNSELQKGASGKELQKLLREEIGLLTKKKEALSALLAEYQREQAELKNSLGGSGVSFDNFGNISNYNEFLTAQRNWANSLSGEAKEKAIEGVKELQKSMERYLELANNSIPKVTEEWNEMTNTINGKATDMLESVRKKLASALTAKREAEKEQKIKALDDRIDRLKEEIKSLEGEDEDKQKKLLKLQAEYDKWANDDSVK